MRVYSQNFKHMMNANVFVIFFYSKWRWDWTGWAYLLWLNWGSPPSWFWSPGWFVLPCDAKWGTWRIDAEAAGQFCVISYVRPYLLVRPVLLLLLQVLTSPPGNVLHKNFVQGRHGRTSWFGRTTKKFPTKLMKLSLNFCRPLPLKDLFFFKIERKTTKWREWKTIKLKGKKKESWLGFTWTGISLTRADSRNGTNSRVVVDTGSMTRRSCSLLESLLAWWFLTVDYGTPSYKFTINICMYLIS
jgi:hypothetical protein